MNDGISRPRRRSRSEIMSTLVEQDTVIQLESGDDVRHRTAESVSRLVESEVSKLSGRNVSFEDVEISELIDQPPEECNSIAPVAGAKKQRNKSDVAFHFTLDEDTRPYFIMLCAALDLPLFGIKRAQLREQISRVVGYGFLAALILMRQWQKENNKLICTPQEFAAYLLKHF